jgi:hypothetical protein
MEEEEEGQEVASNADDKNEQLNARRKWPPEGTGPMHQ